MKNLVRSKLTVLFISALLPITTFHQSPATPKTGGVDELVGLWKAKKRFGPDARGSVIVHKEGDGYIADMMGQILPVRFVGKEMTFELPDQQGEFWGKLERGKIIGHWFRFGTLVNDFSIKAPTSASPVKLEPDGPNRWRGVADPMQDEFTVFLMIERQQDGTYRALMRNPERDIGNQMGINGIIREGNVVRLTGRRRGQNEDRDQLRGSFDPENQIITLSILNRGLTYDFMRDSDDSHFYRRGKAPRLYSYRRPPSIDDGWPVAALEEVNIDTNVITNVFQGLVNTPENASDTPQIHGVVIIRNGRLVLEEYFHGFNRDTMHNTRSASKSMTATLVGAAMQAGVPLKLSTPVYEFMNGVTGVAGSDQQRQAMTLENLLMMSSGIFCDDNNESAPGNETLTWEQTDEPNFLRRYLKLPMDRKPGERAVYCSNDPNLALGMVGQATGESPLYTFDRLIGQPMKIARYEWPLDRARNPYGGGGTNFTLRDFAKFGQLMLNRGVWNGRRILGEDFVARASSPLTQIGRRKYGYLWWVGDYPYKNRRVNVYWALGAGGQNITVIPELDLVVATYSGSYMTPAYGWATGEFIPQQLLPSIREGSRKTPRS
jgi:CubicO group peptidase (beta-lactamase class C family)